MQTLKESKEKLIHDLEDTLFRVALGKVKTIKSKKIYVKEAAYHRSGNVRGNLSVIGTLARPRRNGGEK